MDKFKYIFFPNPDTGLTMWSKVPLEVEANFRRYVAPLIPRADTQTVDILSQQPAEFADYQGATGREARARPGGYLAGDWEMIHEPIEFPALPGIPNTLQDFGIAWGALASVIVSAINAISGMAGKGSITGQSSMTWYEFVAKMRCNKGKYCYCCCPTSASGNCYRIEFRDNSYFELLPRERGKGMDEPNPRFDCRLLPDIVFKLIPNCGKRTAAPGTDGTYPDPPDNGDKGDFWSKYGLWIFGGFVALVLFKPAPKPQYVYSRSKK